MTDQALLAALTQALQREPGSIPLRLHLATLLLESGGEGAALEHFTAVLSQDPMNRQAAEGAAKAAASLGDQARADGYRRLLRALEADSPAAPPATPSSETPPASAPLANPGATPPEKLPAYGPAPEQQKEEPLRQAGGEGKNDANVWDVERPGLTLNDVGGMEHVKRRLTVAFLQPMRNPELRKAYGKSLRGGLLLYGPPGCGKTFIARATAGELGAHFLAVGLSDVLDMWVGSSERNLHEIFLTARRHAPCVLFFDEIDALGQKRVHLRIHGPIRNVVNQLLAEMDGVSGGNDSVFLLAATNQPWDVDAALLRPGRFDRIALVLPPDRPAREAILDFHLRQRPAEKVDVSWVASQTDGYSGADLAHLCETAAELAMEDSVVSGVVRSLTNDDFKQALAQVRPSTQAWFETARNFVLFANESGVYDDLLAYMKTHHLV